MTDNENQQYISSSQNAEQANMRALLELINAGKSAIMDMQEQDHKHDLEKSKLRADVFNKFQNRVFLFVMLFLAIGGMSLIWGNENIGASIIFSILGFLGGTAFGAVFRK